MITSKLKWWKDPKGIIMTNKEWSYDNRKCYSIENIHISRKILHIRDKEKVLPTMTLSKQLEARSKYFS